MTAADEQPGRNGPCPCGSGRKYKKCCGNGKAVDADKKRLAREIVRLRMLTFVLLRDIMQMTGADDVTIPDTVIAQLPLGCTFEQQRIQSPVAAMRFTLKEPEKPQLVQPSKRIILPGRGG